MRKGVYDGIAMLALSIQKTGRELRIPDIIQRRFHNIRNFPLKKIKP